MTLLKKRGLIDVRNRNLSVKQQCKLIGLERSSYYFKPKGESAENQMLMKKIDFQFNKHPYYGVERMTHYLNSLGIFWVNVKRVRRLYRVMNLETLMPKPNTSKFGKKEYKYPYLLGNLTIDKPNQVWQIDITYIPMFRGFMYKFAIIDVYSRKIMGWSISNTMNTNWCIEVITDAIETYGKPEIINSDQGTQFTNETYTEYLNDAKIKISMDSKGRATDNAYIERYWRNYKYEYLYINSINGTNELFEGTEKYVQYYNKERPHKGLLNLTPNEVYFKYTKN